MSSADLEEEDDSQKLVHAIEAISLAETNGDKPLPGDLAVLTAYLDTVPSFQRLKRDPEYDTLLALAARCLKVTKYSAGDVICKQYDRGDRCYIILSGNARVYIYLQEDKLKEIEDLHAKIQGIISSEGEHRGNRVYLNKLKGQLNQLKDLTEQDCLLLDLGHARRNNVRNSQFNEQVQDEQQQQQQQQLTSPPPDGQAPVTTVSTSQLSEFKRTFERKEGTFEAYTVKRVNQMKEKDTFGEFSIAKGAMRSASVIASSEQLILAHMSLEDYSSVFDFDIKHKQRLANTLLTFFPRLDFNVANRLAYFFTEHQLLRKQVLFREGDIADSIYFLEEGSVELKKDEAANTQQSLSKNGLELQQSKQKELSVAILQAKQFFGYEIDKKKKKKQTENDNHQEDEDSPKNDAGSVGVHWCSVSAQSSATRVQVLKIAHMLQVDRSYPFIKVINKKASKCINRYNERFLASQVTFNQRNISAITGNVKDKSNNNIISDSNGAVEQQQQQQQSSESSSSISPLKSNRAKDINLSPSNSNPNSRTSGIKLTKEFQILLEKQQLHSSAGSSSSPRKREQFFKNNIPASPDNSNLSPTNKNILEKKKSSSPSQTPTQSGLSNPQNVSPSQLRSPKAVSSSETTTPAITEDITHPKGAIFEYAETFEQAKKRLRLTKLNTLKTKDQLPQFSCASSQYNRIFKQLSQQCSTPDAADLALSPRKRQLFIEQQNQFNNEIEDSNNKQSSIIFPIGFGGIEQAYNGGFTEADEVQKAIQEDQQAQKLQQLSAAHKMIPSLSSSSSPSSSPRKRKQLYMQGKQSLIDEDFLMPEELSDLYSNSSRNNFDVEGVSPRKFYNGSPIGSSTTQGFKMIIRDKHKTIKENKQAIQLASQDSSHSNSNTSLKKEQRKTKSPLSLEDLEGESPLRKTVSKQESTKKIIRSSLLRLNEIGCDAAVQKKQKNSRLLEASRNHQKLNQNTNEGLRLLLKKQQQQQQAYLNSIQGADDNGDDNNHRHDGHIASNEIKPYINRSRDQLMGSQRNQGDSNTNQDEEEEGEDSAIKNDLILGQKSTSAQEQEVSPFVIVEPLQQRSNSTKHLVFKRERIKLAAVGLHGLLPVQTLLVFASTPQQTQQLLQKQFVSPSASASCSRVQSPMKAIKEERLPEGETSFINETHLIRKKSQGRQSQDQSQEQLEYTKEKNHRSQQEVEDQVEDDHNAPVSLATLQDDHYPQPVYPQNQLSFQKQSQNQQKESVLQVEQQQQQQLRKSIIPLLPLSQLDSTGSKPSSSNSTTDILKRLPASLSANTRHSLNELFLHNQCTLKRPLNVRLPINQHTQHKAQTSRRDTFPTLPEEYQTMRLRKNDSYKNQLEEAQFNKLSQQQTASSLGSQQPVNNNNNNNSLLLFHYPQTTTSSSLSSSSAFKQKSFSTHTIQFFSPRNDHLNSSIRDLAAMTNRDGIVTTNNGTTNTNTTTTNYNNNSNNISLFGSSRKASMQSGPSQKGKQVKGRTQLIAGEFIQQAQISSGFRERSANPIQILCLPVSNRSSKMNSPNASLTAPSFCQVDPSPEKPMKQRQTIQRFPFPILPQHTNNNYNNNNTNTNSNSNYCQVSDRIHAKSNNNSNGIPNSNSSNNGFTVPKDQFSLNNSKAFSRSPIRRLS